MGEKRKIILLVFWAFVVGMFTHSKLYAKYASSEPSASHKITRQGLASWYSKRSPGINKRTASNEVFDDTAMTCAMWGTPFNQFVKVTNIENGKSVIVRVNDRGPHKRYVRKGRIVDLTKNAFREIAGLKKGIIQIQLEFL